MFARSSLSVLFNAYTAVAVVLAAFGALLYSCTRPQSADANVQQGSTVVIDFNLRRTIDTEAGVVCYQFTGANGIFCLPVSETGLGQ